MYSWHFIILLTYFVFHVYSQCPDYSDYSSNQHEPYTGGRYNLSYQRPQPSCRTFNSSVVERTVNRIKSSILDPDLARLFENTYPNTLDTAIRWQGYANNSDEELAFVITGDIDAMWLRDSANQLQPYAPLLSTGYYTSNSSLASLFRGAINLQARYVANYPLCNAFQAPAESGILPDFNWNDQVYPNYNHSEVYQCSFELDSLAAFLQLSVDYHSATKDTSFFSKYSWPKAVESLLDTSETMMKPTYADNGSVSDPPYTFKYCNNDLNNNGIGSPVAEGVGLIRSPFRPSDDPAIYQFFIPGNMMLASNLLRAAEIMYSVNRTLAARMVNMGTSLHAAIEDYAVVEHRKYGKIYAYEVDGYGGINIMDDANTPSLLSAPMSGYVNMSDPVYLNTRRMILGKGNPYWQQGRVISAVGSPHTGLGRAWPMASIVRIMTSEDDEEIAGQLKMLVGSTDGLGLMHESVAVGDQDVWSRQWFGWANGLFGQMIMDLSVRKPQILKRSFQ